MYCETHVEPNRHGGLQLHQRRKQRVCLGVLNIQDRPVHLARGRQEVQEHPHDGSQADQRVSHGKAITHVR